LQSYSIINYRKILADIIVPAKGRVGRRASLHDLRGAVEQDMLIDAAVRERVAPMLYRCLLDTGQLALLQRRQRETLQRHYHRNVLTNIKCLHALGALLERTGAFGIDVVLLQGAALMSDVYRADVGLRPLSDIDLWVAANQLPMLTRALRDLGYRRDALYATHFSKGPVTLDVRTDLMWADRIAARRFLMDAGEQAGVLQRARTVSVEGRAVRRLDPWDEVLYLCLHLLKHYADRLIWLVDILKLTTLWQDEDWRTLCRRAHYLGHVKAMRVVFLLADRLFASHLSERGGGAAVVRFNFMDRRLLAMWGRDARLPEWSPLVFLAPSKGSVAYGRYVWENLFPRRSVLQQVFDAEDDGRPWRLYGLRLKQLGLKALRSLHPGKGFRR